MLVTSCPKRKIRPESGFISPSANFNAVLLPDPATPNRALVSPRGRWKETPFRTTFFSNAMETLSNTTASADESLCWVEGCSIGSVGEDITLPVAKHGKNRLGDKKVDH